MLRLRNAETAIANFFASGLFELGDKLGPILWQFPPNMGFEPELFEAFFRLLPKTTAAAAVLRHASALAAVTSDFIYMRLHGAAELYNSRYTDEQLDRWADCIRLGCGQAAR